MWFCHMNGVIYTRHAPVNKETCRNDKSNQMNLTHIYTKLGTMVTGQKEMQFM